MRNRVARWWSSLISLFEYYAKHDNQISGLANGRQVFSPYVNTCGRSLLMDQSRYMAQKQPGVNGVLDLMIRVHIVIRV